MRYLKMLSRKAGELMVWTEMAHAIEVICYLVSVAVLLILFGVVFIAWAFDKFIEWKDRMMRGG